jgi:hypothetical protein
VSVRVGEGCKGCGGFRNEGFRKLNKVIRNEITMSMLTCHTGEMSGLAWLPGESIIMSSIHWARQVGCGVTSLGIGMVVMG